MRLVLLFSLLATLWSSALEVASLHPLLTDVIKEVGGPQVKVVEIGKPKFDVHRFQPSAKDVRAMSRCAIIFASGKGIETYLPGLTDSLSSGQKVVEVGRTIPSQRVSAEDAVYACCPTHTHGAIDPHWWHNVRNMQRAAGVIARELASADPANAGVYKARGKQVDKDLKNLNSWVKGQIGQIPRGQRHLVTSHAAFGYFCKAYGFKASFVQGLSSDGEISSRQLAETIRQLRAEGIKAVFPEVGSNPKVLSQIAKSSGARVSQPLVADGAVADYQTMIQRNVSNIVAALK